MAGSLSSMKPIRIRPLTSRRPQNAPFVRERESGNEAGVAFTSTGPHKARCSVRHAEIELMQRLMLFHGKRLLPFQNDEIVIQGNRHYGGVPPFLTINKK
jgi:hypothetical protein